MTAVFLYTHRRDAEHDADPLRQSEPFAEEEHGGKDRRDDQPSVYKREEDDRRHHTGEIQIHEIHDPHEDP